MRDAGHQPGRKTRRMRGSLLALACALFCSQAHAQAQIEPEDLTARLKALDALLAGAETGTIAAPKLIDQSGLTELVTLKAAAPQAPRPGATTGPTELAEVQRMNMRLALTMLGQAYGPEDNYDVLTAQADPNKQAVVLRKGRVTLTDLRKILRDLKLQQVPATGPLTLQAPLIIWAGASLDLRKGEVLQLSRTTGAFVMNFGDLNVQGATITSLGEVNPLSPHFVPFVTTADGGTVHMDGAHVTSLGFGATLKFSGFSVMRNALKAERLPSRIENSRFDNIVSVSVSGATGITLRGNTFRDMRSAALVITQTRFASVLGNVFSGTMTTNAIRIEDGSSNAEIAGNIVIGGERAGIMVRKDSSSALINRNIVWHRDGGGITISSSDCGQINDNIVVSNRQKGIEVRASQETRIQNNLIEDNHSAGIWISDQPDGAQTYLLSNRFASNGLGLAAAAGENIYLDGNNFTQQYPRFLGGDLAMQSQVVGADLEGAAQLVLTASGPVDPLPAALACTD